MYHEWKCSLLHRNIQYCDVFEVRNREYEMVSDPKSHLAPRVIKLAEVMSGMSIFLK